MSSISSPTWASASATHGAPFELLPLPPSYRRMRRQCNNSYSLRWMKMKAMKSYYYWRCSPLWDEWERDLDLLLSGRSRYPLDSSLDSPLYVSGYRVQVHKNSSISHNRSRSYLQPAGSILTPMYTYHTIEIYRARMYQFLIRIRNRAFLTMYPEQDVCDRLWVGSWSFE